jgi:hypothetical protein
MLGVLDRDNASIPKVLVHTRHPQLEVARLSTCKHSTPKGQKETDNEKWESVVRKVRWLRWRDRGGGGAALEANPSH